MVIEKLLVIRSLQHKLPAWRNTCWANQAVQFITLNKCEPVRSYCVGGSADVSKHPRKRVQNSRTYRANCRATPLIQVWANEKKKSETACDLQHHLGAKERVMRARKQFCSAASPQQSSNSDGPATSERLHPTRSRAPHAPSDSRIFFSLRYIHSCENRDRVYFNDWRYL